MFCFFDYNNVDLCSKNLKNVRYTRLIARRF